MPYRGKRKPPWWPLYVVLSWVVCVLVVLVLVG